MLLEVALVCCDRIGALKDGEEVGQQVDQHSAGKERAAINGGG
jgi:hypothetical protein